MCIPTGIGYIGSELLATGKYDVFFLDYQLQNVSDDDVLDMVRRENIQIVGIRAFCGDYLNTINLCRKIKQVNPDVASVIGGPLATFSWDVVLKNADVDFCMRGEAETSFCELLDRWQDDFSDIQGIAYRKNAEIICQGGIQIPKKQLDDIAMPPYENMNVEAYVHNRRPFRRIKKFFVKFRSLDISSGRGCPYSCNFCAKQAKNYRKRSVDSVMDEVVYLKNRFGINHFLFNDELFIYKNDNWLVELCERLAPLEVAWTCSCRANLVKPGHIGMMKSAGCARIAVGFESGSQRILDAMNKRISLDDIRFAINEMKRYGITPVTPLIIGTPEEDKESIEDTIQIFDELHIRPYKFNYLQPYPGSKYFYDFLNNGLIEDHEKLLIEFSSCDNGFHEKKNLIFNATEMDDRELIRLKDYAEEKMNQNYKRYCKRKFPLLFLYNRITSHVSDLIFKT